MPIGAPKALLQHPQRRTTFVMQQSRIFQELLAHHVRRPKKEARGLDSFP
jgi:hypothetical protein